MKKGHTNGHRAGAYMIRPWKPAKKTEHSDPLELYVKGIMRERMKPINDYSQLLPRSVFNNLLFSDAVENNLFIVAPNTNNQRYWLNLADTRVMRWIREVEME